MKLAVDANILLSALIGGRARLAMNHPSVEELFTTEHTLSEVEEYSAILARKKRLRVDLVLLAGAALPVTIVDHSKYASRLPEASRSMMHRDPEDVELLALTLDLKVPLWSNDKDFESMGIELFTTERLLRKLGIIY